MNKISKNITIDFEINDVVFTNINIFEPKSDIDGKIIRVNGYNANHDDFRLTLNDRPIYPLENIILVD